MKHQALAFARAVALRPRGPAAARISAASGALLVATTLRADPLSVVNALRAERCGGVEAAGAPLQHEPLLDEVARALSRNPNLESALEASEYPATSSASFHLRGSRADADMRRMLAARYCASINDPRYVDVGAFQSGDQTWIVLAAPRVEPPPLDPGATAERVLALVNEARAEARRCGREEFAGAQPLTLSTALSEAAAAHARDMARRGTLTHNGADGSSSGERITRAGYSWRASGENVAAGQRDADTVVTGWLGSPGHCATLMNPHFTEMGIAFEYAVGKNPGIYWAQTFGAPQ